MAIPYVRSHVRGSSCKSSTDTGLTAAVDYATQAVMGRGGDRLEEQESATLRLEDDPRFVEFLRPDFSDTEFASRILAEGSASAQAKIRQLDAGVAELNTRIAQEVTAKQDKLLGHAASLRDAEGAIQRISTAADSLQSSMTAVREEILEPYEAIRSRTLELAESQATLELLRHVLQRLKLTQRLRTHVGTAPSGAQGEIPEMGALDLGKAAKLLTDIATVEQEADLTEIDILTADDDFLSHLSSHVQAQAKALLEKGMESLSQTEVGSALQIFFNLNALQQAVRTLVQGYTDVLRKALPAALDAKRLASEVSGASSGLLTAPGGARSAGASLKVQEAMWQKLAAFIDRLQASAIAVWHLQRVLAKKRDPLSHVLFLDVVLEEGAPLPLEAFWDAVTDFIRSALDEAMSSTKGSVVRESLVHSYPRLASLVDSLFKKLHQETDVKGVMPAAAPETQEAVVAATASCMNLYLAAVLSRVSDAVTLAFPGGNRALPTAAELHKCIGRLHEELKAVGENARLATLTAQAVGNALHLLAEKAEYMSSAGQELRAVTGACTSAQLRNLTLANQLQEVARSVVVLLPRMPPAAAAALRAPLEVVEASAIEAVMPLMRAVVERGESLLLKMHEQGFGREDSPPVAKSSPYIQELSRHLSHSRVEYLSKFSPAATPQSSGSVGAALTQRFAARLLVFFVRHASLLRPLSHAGKLQLAKDIAELEEAVGNNLWPLEQLGPPQRALRAFRRLLFLATGAITASPLLQELPISVVLHHLYSRAAPALQSPHTRSGFSPEQYSLWLDQHTMAEAVRYIKSALEACASATEEDSESAEVLQVMMHLCSLQKATA